MFETHFQVISQSDDIDLLQLLFQKDQWDILKPVEFTRNDSDFLVAQLLVHRPGVLIMGIGVHPQITGSRLPRVVFIKRDKSLPVAAVSCVWINHQSMQHHDFIVFSRILPVPLRVSSNLLIVNNSSSNDLALVVFQDEKVASF